MSTGAMASNLETAAPVAAAVVDDPATASAAQPDWGALVDAAQAEIALLEKKLLLARANMSFYRRALRQAQVAALAKVHGVDIAVGDVEDAAADTGVASCDPGESAPPPKAHPVPRSKAAPKEVMKSHVKKLTADGQCKACSNEARGVSPGVGHYEGPACKKVKGKPGRRSKAVVVALAALQTANEDAAGDATPQTSNEDAAGDAASAGREAPDDGAMEDKKENA